MSRLPQPGADEGAWGTVLNDFLLVSHAADGTLQASAIPDGSVTLTKLSQAYIPVSQKSAPSGVASLDSSGYVPTAQIPALAQYATDTAVVHLAGTETVAGLKTFSLPPQVPVPTQPGEAANKQYIDTAIISAVPVPVQTQVFSSAGVVAVDVGTQRLYNDSGKSWTLSNVRASVGIAPAGASIIIDVKVNDATIFALPADQPTIPSGGLTSGKMIVTGVTTVAIGQYITVDVTQVGSTTAGSNLTVQLTVQ
jgi:hypothetical protein